MLLNITHKILNKKISTETAIIFAIIAIIQIAFIIKPSFLNLSTLGHYYIISLIELVAVPITTSVIVLYALQKIKLNKLFKKGFITGYLVILGISVTYLIISHILIVKYELYPIGLDYIAHTYYIIMRPVFDLSSISNIYSGLVGSMLLAYINLFFCLLVLMPILSGIFFGSINYLLKKGYKFIKYR